MSEALKKKSFKELYKELEGLPENVVGEIINGELVATPRPAPKHARASSALGVLLCGPFDLGSNGGPGGWWILDEPQVHFIEKVVVPDIAGWRKERMPKLPETSYFELAPDWVCEVLSPSTASYDKIFKFQIYAENAVSHYWIIDPINRVLETFTLNKDKYEIGPKFGNSDKVKTPPFEEIEFNLENLWVD